LWDWLKWAINPSGFSLNWIPHIPLAPIADYFVREVNPMIVSSTWDQTGVGPLNRVITSLPLRQILGNSISGDFSKLRIGFEFLLVVNVTITVTNFWEKGRIDIPNLTLYAKSGSGFEIIPGPDSTRKHYFMDEQVYPLGTDFTDRVGHRYVLFLFASFRKVRQPLPNDDMSVGAEFGLRLNSNQIEPVDPLPKVIMEFSWSVRPSNGVQNLTNIIELYRPDSVPIDTSSVSSRSSIEYDFLDDALGSNSPRVVSVINPCTT